jgi:hypothetical protein
MNFRYICVELLSICLRNITFHHQRFVAQIKSEMLAEKKQSDGTNVISIHEILIKFVWRKWGICVKHISFGVYSDSDGYFVDDDCCCFLTGVSV